MDALPRICVHEGVKPGPLRLGAAQAEAPRGGTPPARRRCVPGLLRRRAGVPRRDRSNGAGFRAGNGRGAHAPGAAACARTGDLVRERARQPHGVGNREMCRDGRGRLPSDHVRADRSRAGALRGPPGALGADRDRSRRAVRPPAPAPDRGARALHRGVHAAPGADGARRPGRGPLEHDRPAAPGAGDADSSDRPEAASAKARWLRRARTAPSSPAWGRTPSAPRPPQLSRQHWFARTRPPRAVGARGACREYGDRSRHHAHPGALRPARSCCRSWVGRRTRSGSSQWRFG